MAGQTWELLLGSRGVCRATRHQPRAGLLRAAFCSFVTGRRGGCPSVWDGPRGLRKVHNMDVVPCSVSHQASVYHFCFFCFSFSLSLVSILSNAQLNISSKAVSRCGLPETGFECSKPGHTLVSSLRSCPFGSDVPVMMNPQSASPGQ